MRRKGLDLFRRATGLAAIAAASVLFWDVSRKYLDFADRYCGEAEAGGNCRSLQANVVDTSTPFFVAAMVVLAVLVLLPGPKPRGE